MAEGVQNSIASQLYKALGPPPQKRCRAPLAPKVGTSVAGRHRKPAGEVTLTATDAHLISESPTLWLWPVSGLGQASVFFSLVLCARSFSAMVNPGIGRVSQLHPLAQVSTHLYMVSVQPLFLKKCCKNFSFLVYFILFST